MKALKQGPVSFFNKHKLDFKFQILVFTQNIFATVPPYIAALIAGIENFKYISGSPFRSKKYKVIDNKKFIRYILSVLTT